MSIKIVNKTKQTMEEAYQNREHEAAVITESGGSGADRETSCAAFCCKDFG